MSKRHDLNVFSPEFLHHLDRRDDDGNTAVEAAFAGPWRVVERGEQRFALLHATTSGDGPAEAVFESRETVLLLAGLFPLLGRECPYKLAHQESELGFDVQCIFDGDLRTIGSLRYFHLELLEALHVAEWFLRSPEALARLIDAATHEVVARSGRLVAERLGEEKEA